MHSSDQQKTKMKEHIVYM